MVALNGSQDLNGTVSRQTRTVRIGRRLVGDGQPCFVLAEGGLNHNGDPALAAELVDIAAIAQADGVKFQKRSVVDLLTREAFDAPYLHANSFGPTYGEHRLRLELTRDDWLALRDRASAQGVEFLGSAWDLPSVDFLAELDPPAYKVGSPDLTNLPLLDYVARMGKPVVLSTGMSTLEDVDSAVETVLRHTSDLILLQCTSSYPSEFGELNLRAMAMLRERYGVLVGYSGHERGIAVSEAAAVLGACLLERHFTKDRTLPGPDHAASLEPTGLSKLVRDIRNVEAALGEPVKELLPSEQEKRERLAKSVVAARSIPRGTRLAPELLTVKCPGTGIAANRIGDLVGRLAPCDIAEDSLLPREALQWPRE